MTARQLSFDTVGCEDAAERVGRAAFAGILELRRGDPAFRLTADTLIAVLRPALAKELPKAARIAGRNVLFDALAAACGLEAPFTKSAAGQVGKALSEILKAFPTTDAAEMARIATAVRKKYENAGPMAVSTHFHEFVRRQRKPQDATAPVGWLAKLNELYPHSTLAKGGAFEIERETEYQWKQLEVTIQDAIRKALA